MRFIDIHSHILHGVDDGAENPEASLAMIRQASDLHVEHILATPHVTEVMNDKIGELFLNRFRELKKTIEAEGLPIQISLASELFYTEKIFGWLDRAWATFRGEEKYLLFELPLFEIPDKVDKFIFHCRMKGLIPILAHPERYVRLHDKPELLHKWYQHGCFMQLNAGSLVGQFGERIRQFSERLLQSGIYQFLGSDAHETRERNFEMLIRAGETIAETVSQSYAELLAYDNPGRALRGGKVQTPDYIEIPDKERWYLRYFKKIFTSGLQT